MSSLTKGRAAWVLVWIAIAAPFLIYAVNIPRFGELQRNDYWGDFRQLVSNDTLTHSPLRWLRARSNEHRIALPLLLWTANIELSRGDNRVLSALSLLLLIATFACLWTLLPAAARGSPLPALGFGLPLAALIATPVAAHCWVMGFSGNQWYFANLSAAAGIACFARLRPDGSLRPLLLAALATLPGAFAHSTHLALWPALLLGALLMPVPRWTAIVCGALATAFVGLFLWGYVVPRGHPTPGGEPGSLLGFVAAYMSLRASADHAVAQAWGALGLLLFSLAVVVVLRRPRAERATLMPILLVACYALGNGIGTSLARVGFGLYMAFASRYASLPSLFWLGTLGTLGVAAYEITDRRRRTWALAALGLVMTAFVIATNRSGLPLFRQHLKGAERQPLGALAMRWNVWDVDALRHISFSPDQTRQSPQFFAARRHRPYDRIAEWPLGERWSGAALDETAEPAGRWRTAKPVAPGFFAVSGNILEQARPGERIVFLDNQGTMRGGAVFVPRAEAPRPPLLGRRPAGTHWEGYLEDGCRRGLRAYLETGDGPNRKLVQLRTAEAAKNSVAARCAAN